MAWRIVVVTQPSSLAYKHQALRVQQDQGNVSIPLEDIAVVVIDNPEVTLTAGLLSAMASKGIASITVGVDHHPNGVHLPLLPHSRPLKVLRAQMKLSLPRQKRLWQQVVRSKISNQAAVLTVNGHVSGGRTLRGLADRVRSGDSGNLESQASRLYFPTLFGPGFKRSSAILVNSALNYCYAVVRAAIARSLVAYGFIPTLGLHHSNEQNAFNLADDLIEPFRPLVDAHVFEAFTNESERVLDTEDKALLINVLLLETTLPAETGATQRCSILAAIDATVVSLVRSLKRSGKLLDLPVYTGKAFVS